VQRAYGHAGEIQTMKKTPTWARSSHAVLKGFTKEKKPNRDRERDVFVHCRGVKTKITRIKQRTTSRPIKSRGGEGRAERPRGLNKRHSAIYNLKKRGGLR